MRSKLRKLTRKIYPQLLFFTRCTFVFLLFLVWIRVMEYFSFDALYGVGGSLLEYPVRGILSDLVFGLAACAVLLLPYLLLGLVHRFAGRVFLVLSQMLLLWGSVALMEYFLTTLSPLGKILFITPFSEAKHIAFSSLEFDFRILLKLIFPLLFLPAILIFKKSGRKSILPVVALSFLALIVELKYPLYRIENFPSVMNYYQAVSKGSFFANETYSYLVEHNENLAFSSPEFREAIRKYHRQMGIDGVEDERFPLWHQRGEAEDVLGPFFKKTAQPPNVVFLMVEGLGRAVSGEDAYMGSFTPFLDSLAQRALYWPNFLGNGERTFAALPSATGSLPFGRQGFTEQREEIPRHLSLLSILKKNDYHTGFYYGGWAGFTSMDYYLHYQNVDELVEAGDFPAYFDSFGYQWGYHDRELYQYYFQKLDSLRKVNPNQPLMHNLLTLSTHEPFTVPDLPAYLEKFEQKLAGLDIEEEYRTRLLNNKNVYAGFLYADEAIKFFLKEYQKRPGYEHTIFCIFGDHRFTTIPRNSLDMYHVPLLIYSPMLKRSKTMASINSQRNIMPSLLNYLDGNFQLSLPEGRHWVDLPLDTADQFRNLHQIALMTKERTARDYVDSLYFLSGDLLYLLKPDMSLTWLEGASYEPIRDELREKRDRHQLMGEYTCLNNHLIPKGKMEDYLERDLIYDSEEEVASKMEFTEAEEWEWFFKDLPIPDDHKSYVEVSFTISTENPGSLPLLVFRMDNASGEMLDWQQSPVNEKIYAQADGTYSFKFTQIIFPEKGKTHSLTCGIWNHNNGIFTLSQPEVRVVGFSE